MSLIDLLNANPTLKNFLIAILTALATTMTVEYLAKPKLEARKARIIRDRNQIDEVIFQFQELGLVLGTMRLTELKYVESLSDFLVSQVEQAEKSLDRLQQSLARLPLKYVQRQGRHMKVAAFHQGLLRSKLALLKGYLEGEKYDASFEQIVELATLTDQLHLIDVTFELSRHSWLHKLVNRASVQQQAEAVAVAMEANGLSLDKAPVSISAHE
ncbi:hypothetical protein [Nonomuraea sp. NPDC001699]